MVALMQVAQGSDPSALVAMDTATVLYARAQQRYFSSYSPVIGFYIYESAPYWNASVQRDLLEYTKGFQRISWLESYLGYLSELNQSTSQPRRDFTRTLRLRFLHQPRYAHFADDIIFAERGAGEEPEVAASRVFLVAKTTENKREEMSVLLDTLRRLSLTSRVRFLIFNPSFVYLDRYAAAVGWPLRHSLLAVIFLLGLASLALVEPLVAAWLGLTLLSVLFGVVGFMTLWGVGVGLRVGVVPDLHAGPRRRLQRPLAVRLRRRPRGTAGPAGCAWLWSGTAWPALQALAVLRRRVGARCLRALQPDAHRLFAA
ncbi:hypothetical protein CRUP_035376 [Coryphaenoides rupestris]|nr:hypothetical protein CRUP_035376 [Coryphaenoides rupestris]